jgi:hypothetical protein
MTNAFRAANAGIARRDFMIAGAGAAALGSNVTLLMPAPHLRRRDRRLPLPSARRSQEISW